MESLTHEYGIRSLLYILEAGKTSVPEVAEALNISKGTLAHAINALERAEMVVTQRPPEAPYSRRVQLTELGVRVAEKLAEVEELLGWGSQKGIT